jgi:hypothetical protein
MLFSRFDAYVPVVYHHYEFNVISCGASSHREGPGIVNGNLSGGISIGTDNAGIEKNPKTVEYRLGIIDAPEINMNVPTAS